MRGSMKAKRHIVTTLWGVSCLVLAGVLWARCVSPVQGCTQQDLKTAAADPWAVQTVQAQADGQAQAKRVYLTFDDGPSATTETVLVGFRLIPSFLAAMAKASRLLLNMSTFPAYSMSHRASQLVGGSCTMVLLYTMPTTPQV